MGIILKLWRALKYKALLFYFPGEIVYEDEYQIVVKVDENVVIEDLQDSWSPKD